MASDPFLVGVLFGFVPAMGFLYILLHNYQDFFEEKRIFKTFFFGLVVGLIVTIAEGFLGPGRALNPDDPDALGVPQIVVFAILFGVLEAMVAAAVLNWRTFRSRRDTPFYGAALGLGVGAINAVFIVGRAVPVLTAGTTGWAEVYTLILLGLYFIGAILVRAGAFVLIGQGTGQGNLPARAAQASAILGGYTLLFFLLPRTPPAAANVLPFVALAAAIAFIAHILRNVLDRVVPDEVLREAGVHRRRMARRKMRGPSTEDPETTRGGLEDEAVGHERRE